MAVRLEGVTVRYGETAALDAVDLVVAPGERVALIGSSGAGKTTLLDVVRGVVTPDDGTVSVLGEELSRLRGGALRGLRRRVGTVGQDHDMAPSLRVIHNVNAGRLGSWSTAGALWSLIVPTGRGDAVAALDAVGLGHRADSRTDDLSGGERQRVAVARVLRQQPELVLADEPTSSVDPALADLVMGLLCAEASTPRWTLLVTLHDPELARRHVDRLVGLSDGQVVLDAPAADVSDDDLSALYGT